MASKSNRFELVRILVVTDRKTKEDPLLLKRLSSLVEKVKDAEGCHGPRIQFVIPNEDSPIVPDLCRAINLVGNVGYSLIPTAQAIASCKYVIAYSKFKRKQHHRVHRVVI